MANLTEPELHGIKARARLARDFIEEYKFGGVRCITPILSCAPQVLSCHHNGVLKRTYF